MVNKEGDFRKGGFIPFKCGRSKIVKCPRCKHPERYKKERVKCFKCDKKFIKDIGENKPYCKECEKEAEGEG
jgi:hypothetical protein